MTFKEKIVRLRKIKSLTQDEFASAVGVSRQAVYKWESGQSYPEVQKLIEIKLLFGISIDDLLDDTYEVEMPEKKRKKRTVNPKKEEAKVENIRKTPAPVSEKAEEPVSEEVKEEVREETSEEAVEEASVQDESTAQNEEVESNTVAEAPVSEGEEETQQETEEVKPFEEENKEESIVTVSEEKEPEENEKKKKGFFSRMFSKK
jgi:transcriptional regulator with XRE-family HTH domain